MDVKTRYKVRRVVSRGTPSYQLGHYEMTGKPGSRRSLFKVLVHLGEHATPEAALKAWREDVERARAAGRDKAVARLEEKIRKLEGGRPRQKPSGLCAVRRAVQSGSRHLAPTGLLPWQGDPRDLKR